MIKDYFLNFNAYNNDISIDFTKGQATIHEGNHPPWIVHLVDTGLYTQTGGRLGRLKDWLEGKKPLYSPMVMAWRTSTFGLWKDAINPMEKSPPLLRSGLPKDLEKSSLKKTG